MPTSLEALQVILYLLPGVVTLRIKELLSFPNKVSDISRTIDGIVLTFLNLSIFFTINLLAPDQFNKRYLDIIIIFLIAVVLGVILGNDYLVSKFYSLLRWLKLTKMTGRVDPWSDAFNNIRGIYVRIRLSDDRKYMGWPKYYSDDPKVKELFLANAYLISKTGVVSKIEGPGVLIPITSDIIAIEFLDPLPE